MNISSASKLASDLTPYEYANVITHGFGMLMTLISIPILIYYGYDGSFLHLSGLLAFSISLLMVYTASTFYHKAIDKDLKHKLRIIDHICIYFLIAGSHTPFIFYYLNNSTGYIFLAVMWLLVLLGVVFKLFFTGRFDNLSVAMYVGMGWMSVFVMDEILQTMSTTCFNWLIGGGVFYMVGTIFYKWESLPYHHSIWHLFVLAGSFCHFVALMFAATGG